MGESTGCSHRHEPGESVGPGGICPSCLLELGLGGGKGPIAPGSGSPAASEMPTVIQPVDRNAERLRIGRVLGDRYRIEERLGSGAMGEVWRAADLKLRVDVALKALPSRLVGNPKRREMMRQEVRSAREVISPNVCRIYDLVEADGQELISMEYIDGVTLSENLRREGPLELQQASEIAMQLLAGLEAIHQSGFVHRDIKPENIMITRAGRVVTMDFGIAKPVAEGHGGTIAGTPVYMAPEQRAGGKPDARWDLFSAGIVLAEMLVGHEESEDLLRGVREQPPRLPESPWRAILERAVAARLEDRYPSSRSLGQALEEVTLRISVAEDRRPYPGLSSFQEADAEFFFGRESQVEEVWKKLAQPHLLGIIGPSGAGKSSFLRAGLLPALPEGWHSAVCTPGARPLVALAQALSPDLAGDAEAIAQLVRFEEPDIAVEIVSRWKGKRAGALLIVDQFEELFTLNPPNVQAQFAEILGRLSLEADVHVLLSMRDDFLIHCQSQPALAPLFSDLTALLPPTGSALRRALVQPALRCGYRFEDDNLVDEMLAEVRQERGALPLLAFAVASLWERRDKQQGLLTREAYEEIGGVAGALAQHAERTLERAGMERQPLVRELFRNLVTAHGTRAVRVWDELLEVFEDRPTAEAILRELVDARLLTSYEEPGEDDTQRVRRVEIIHESLLSAWPRLVRWQTQDEDSAQLRDQLRMAARMWEERGRPGDLLWTGTSLREYQLWRERYPGGLSTKEQEFTDAMIHRAGRTRRRRRLGLAAGFVTLLAVLAVVGALWWQAELAGEIAEARQLAAIGQRVQPDNPSLALAYMKGSLERVDDARVRRLALEILSSAPSATVAMSEASRMQAFSPDGRWLATGHWNEIRRVRREGGPSDRLEALSTPLFPVMMQFIPESGQLFSTTGLGADVPFWEVHLWDINTAALVRRIRVGKWLHPRLVQGNFVALAAPREEDDRLLLRAWPLEGGEAEDLAYLPESERSGGWRWSMDPTARWITYRGPDRLSVMVLSVEGGETARPVAVGRHEAAIQWIEWHPDGERLASIDQTGEIRLWSRLATSPEPLRVLRGREDSPGLVFDKSGNRLVALGRDGTAALWDLTGPPDADALVLQAGKSAGASPFFGAGFGPDGQWLAVGHTGMGVVLWPLARQYPYILRGHQGQILGLEFAPDGKALFSTSQDGTAREWPLTPEAGGAQRIILRGGILWHLAVDPQASSLLISAPGGTVGIVDRKTGEARILASKGNEYMPVAFNRDGTLAAMTSAHDGGGRGTHIRVVKVDSGETAHLLDAEDSLDGRRIEFTPEGRILAGGGNIGGIRVWDLETESYELLAEGRYGPFDLSADGRLLLAARTAESGGQELTIRDLETGEVRSLPTGGAILTHLTLDPTGVLAVTADEEGIVRVGPVSGGEPHLLLGHEGPVTRVAVSPDGRWIASAGVDHTIRLWPMPAGQPLHILPHGELIERLASLTNIHVVEDATAPEGYMHEVLPFPGWERVPRW